MFYIIYLQIDLVLNAQSKPMPGILKHRIFLQHPSPKIQNKSQTCESLHTTMSSEILHVIQNRCFFPNKINNNYMFKIEDESPNLNYS